MKKRKAAALCGVLSVSMLASMLAGCGDKEVEEIDGTQAAVTINGEVINVGEANMLLRYNEAHTLEELSSYGFDYNGSLWDNEYTSSDDEESSSSAYDYTNASPTTYGESLKDDTINNICEMVLLRQQADEYDVTIPTIYQSELKVSAKYEYQYNSELFDKIGITQDDVQDLLELEGYQKYVKEAMVADTDTDVSEDEAKQRKLTYTRAWKTKDDDDGNEVALSDDEIADLKGELEQLIKDAEATGDTANADMSELQKAIDEDNLSTATYSYGYGEDEVGLNEQVNEAIQDLKDGEIYDQVIETDDALFVVRLDAAVDEERTEMKKESIISEREQENYESKMADIREKAEIEVSDYWLKNITVTDKNYYLASSTSTNSEDTTESTESVSGVSSVSDTSSVSTVAASSTAK